MNETSSTSWIYIYENYMDAEESVPTDQILLEEELVQAGSRRRDQEGVQLAGRAGLAPGLADLRRRPAQPFDAHLQRAREQQRIDLEIQGMLLYLEQTGILDPMSRELVIEARDGDRDRGADRRRRQMGGAAGATQPAGPENCLPPMEELVYNGEPVYLH